MGFWMACFPEEVVNTYPGFNLNFDIRSDEEAKESFSADCSGEPTTLAEAHFPSSPSTPNPTPDV